MWDPGRFILRSLILSVLVVSVLTEVRRRTFAFFAPNRFSDTELVCISLTTYPANVSVSLLEEKTDSVISSAESFIAASYGCLKIVVPSRSPDAAVLAKLVVRVSLSEDAPVLNALRMVNLVPDPWLTFISTDKPVYGQDDLVQIRIFSVNYDFFPRLGKVDKLWVENPQGVHIALWKDVDPVGGFIDRKFQLVGSPFPGLWTVNIKIDGHVQKRTFFVEKSSLPSFQVDLNVPDTVEEKSVIKAKVCSRYLFDRPVAGDIELSVTVECPFIYYCSENSAADIITDFLDNNGCAEVSLLVDEGNQTVWRTLLVNATVREEGTGNLQSAFKRVKIVPTSFFGAVSAKYKFESEWYKPGLPFYGKLKLSSRSLSVPATSVRLCASVDNATICAVSPTNNGVIDFVLFFPSVSSLKKMRLEASWQEQGSKEGKKTAYLQPWYSSSSSYLKLLTNRMTFPLGCTGTTTFQFLHNMEDNLKFFVLMKVRGSIKFFGTRDDLANVTESAYVIERSPSTVSLLDNPENAALKSITFSLTIQPEMSPSFHLTIYTLREDSDIIADSSVFKVKPCFGRKISASWNRRESLPGSNVTLSIISDPESMCAISAVDRKIELWGRPIPKLEDLIFEELSSKLGSERRKNFDLSRCVNGSGTASEIYGNSLTYGPEFAYSYADYLDAFEDSGLLLISDSPLPRKPCRQLAIEPRMTERRRLSAYGASDLPMATIGADGNKENDAADEDAYVTMRSNFADSWIFSLVPLRSENNLNVEYKIPDSITEWSTYVTCLSSSSGLSVTRPGIIRSFQPFFVDFSLPPSVKRRELLFIPISIFNYMNESLPVKVVLKPSANFRISGELEKSLCLASNAKATQIFLVSAEKIGPANISVKAEVDSFSTENCGNLNTEYKVDHVMKETNVRGEGHVVEEIRSALLCGDGVTVGNNAHSSSVNWTVTMSATKYVDQTVSSEVRVSGDIFGPPLLNVDRFITLPTGCGEQSMFSFAVNLLLVRYLLSRHTVSQVEPRVTKALKNLDHGYQQQLSFRHSDGSYSAFGPGKSNSSIWLTAFVVRYFTEARQFIHEDENDLEESMNWLKRQQMENGCFLPIGDVYHWDLKRRLAATDSPQALTAYILISLLKADLPVSSPLVKNSVYCLKASDTRELYTDVLTVYALALAGEMRDAAAGMRYLSERANRSYQLLWWGSGDDATTEKSIEMTSYCVLSLIKLGGPYLASASDAVRWLINYQNSNGGFISTQDTIIALEAIAEYSNAMPRLTESFTVTLAYSSGNHSFDVNEGNKNLQQVVSIPPFQPNVHFNVIGSGCALVQYVLKYNVRRVQNSKTLKLQVKVDPVSAFDSTFHVVEVCAKTRGPLEVTGMAVVEVSLPTGFFPDRTSLYRTTTQFRGVKKWEEFEDHVIFYIESLTSHKQCISFLIKRETCVNSTSPLIAKVYDYYNNQHFASANHSLQQNCQSIDTWILTDNLPALSRYSRDVSDQQSSQNSFSNFMDVDQSLDLDVPGDDGNPVAIFALPPPPVTGGQKCPQCFGSPPELFPKLYCSSKLAMQMRFLGKEVMEVVKDMSPGMNATAVKRTIAYTVKQRCTCDLLTKENVLAFIMVTPPRFFNIRTVQVVHMDDSFAIFPWDTLSNYSATLFNAPQSCSGMLSITRK